jgi:signal transduction histidine kinase
VHATGGHQGLARWIAHLNSGRVGGGPLLLLEEQGGPLPGSAPLPAGTPTTTDIDALRERHGVRLFALDGDLRGARWLGIAPRKRGPQPDFLIARSGPRHPLQAELGLVRLAQGDFAVGIDRRTLARRDELAALARDFARMAGKLEKLLAAQRQLLRDVSHELRSPLARLQVAAALARRKGTGLVDAEIDRMELETARVDELIGQLMRLEAAAGACRPRRSSSAACWRRSHVTPGSMPGHWEQVSSPASSPACACRAAPTCCAAPSTTSHAMGCGIRRATAA